jgi:hypothetical protein
MDLLPFLPEAQNPGAKLSLWKAQRLPKISLREIRYDTENKGVIYWKRLAEMPGVTPVRDITQLPVPSTQLPVPEVSARDFSKQF